MLRFLKHLWEEMLAQIWNTLLNINSVLFAGACLYTVYAAGASIYYWTLRPIEFGVILALILFCTEIVFSVINETT